MPIPARSNEDKRWQSQHERHIKECYETNPRVLLIGDSTIQRMQYYTIWNELVAPLGSANFGIDGDCVQNVLHRIENGALDRIQPKVIVLHVGTNNIYSNPDQISDGVIKIINALFDKIPEAHIIFWALLPRGEFPNKLSDKLELTNKILEEKLEAIPKCEFISTGDGLRGARGRIASIDMFDYLHLTEVGYRKTFIPIITMIRSLLKITDEQYLEYVD